jgi:hypothetical protein
MAKAKWLEGSSLAIATAIVESLSQEEVTEKEIKKALKGAEELKERAALDEAEPTVQGLLSKVIGLGESIVNITNSANELYVADLEAAGVNDSKEDSEENPNEDEAAIDETPKEEKKKNKKSKKADKEAEVDYSTMSKKALKVAAKEAGIKVSKKMEKEDLIEALQAANK